MMSNGATARTENAPLDVVVVGSGPAGASAAIFLARHGLSVALATRSTWVADSPRAHITNQRTMEVLRAVGLEEACRAVANPRELMANQVLCTSIAGQEIARLWAWGNDPGLASEYLSASPSSGCDLPQHLLEPILLGEAARLGVRLRFQTQFERLEQDADGVDAHFVDLQTGEELTLRASYLVGADGGQSAVAREIGLPFIGKSGMSNAMSVRFTADLTRHVAHRPGSLYNVIQPDRADGMGNAMIRMVEPWTDWVAYFVHLGERSLDLTEEEARREIQQIIGDDSVDVEVTGLFPWRVNHVVASEYSSGRVFCVGDAVHRHPPMNGLGTNTSIQDSFNLAWKLAYRVKGLAGPGLLDSYGAERQPIGTQVVDRAITSWHLAPELIRALGLDPTAPVETRREQFALLSAATPEGRARREATARANANMSSIYHANGVEMNQVYTSESCAVVTDGEPDHVFARDPERIIQPTSHPGSRLPHAWLGVPGATVSTLDLVSPEAFTLLTRIQGQAWVAAAEELGRELGIELRAHRIGIGSDVTDAYGDFARLSEVDEDGCLLVRPDQHVAWRRRTGADDPVAELRRVLRAVLDLD